MTEKEIKDLHLGLELIFTDAYNHWYCASLALLHFVFFGAAINSLSVHRGRIVFERLIECFEKF